MKFYELMKLTPHERATVYHAWACDERDRDPELAVLFDATAAELELVNA